MGCRGAWRRPHRRSNGRAVRPWFGAGGEGRLQALARDQTPRRLHGPGPARFAPHSSQPWLANVRGEHGPAAGAIGREGCNGRAPKRLPCQDGFVVQSTSCGRSYGSPKRQNVGNIDQIEPFAAMQYSTERTHKCCVAICAGSDRMGWTIGWPSRRCNAAPHQ